LRDFLIHHYFGVDLDIVWQTILVDIPPLRSAILQIIDKTEAS